MFRRTFPLLVLVTLLIAAQTPSMAQDDASMTPGEVVKNARMVRELMQ